MRYMDPNHPEMKYKNAAIKSLLKMLDSKILEEHQSMRAGGNQKESMVEVEEELPDVNSGEVMGEAAEEAMMNEQPEDMDMAEGKTHQKAPLDMNRVVHEMNKAEDDPRFDVDNKDVAMSLDEQMNKSLEENAKYRPRVRNEEKGNIFTTKRSAPSTEPMPQQTLRKKKYK